MAPEAGIFKWKGRLGPLELRVSENTFKPSTISVLLAEALEVQPGDTVVDVGCGSGILSIVAAKLGVKTSSSRQQRFSNKLSSLP